MWKSVILKVFKAGYQCCVIFPCLFLSCVLVVFNSPVATPAHGLLGFSPIPRLRFISEYASLHCIFVPPPCFHFTTLLTRALFYGSFHCSYVFVPRLAFHKRQIFIFGALSYFKLGSFWKVCDV